jgi:hypothetical protein
VNKVTALPGVRPPSTGPNEVLVEVLRDALRRAESGELQSFVGTGFTLTGNRLAAWAPHHDNVWEMLGALESMKIEYLHRYTEILKR